MPPIEVAWRGEAIRYRFVPAKTTWDGTTTAKNYAGNLRDDAAWFQHAADCVLPDALTHNGDRHNSNYLVAELSAGTEQVRMPFPVYGV